MATTMRKRAFALLAMLVLLFAMSIPVLADYTNGLNGSICIFGSFNGQTGCGVLNAYPLTNQGVINGTPLRIWSLSSGSSDQSFKCEGSSGGYLVLKVKTPPNDVSNPSEYTLMVNRSSSTGNAILWSGNNAYYDSNLICTGSRANGYRFRLANYPNQYLNATGPSNGSIINFVTGVSGETSSLWSVLTKK